MSCSSTRERSIQHAASLSQAVDLLRHGARTVIVPHLFRSLRSNEIRTIHAHMDLRDIPLRITAAGVPVPREVPRFLHEPLRRLAEAHAAVVDANLVAGRVAFVSGTPCPRFHVDKLHMRTLCTLRGPGCVVAPDSALDLEKLFGGDIPFDAEPSEFESYVVKNPELLEHSQERDVVFLVGAGEHGSKLAKAAVHRSPIRDAKRDAPRLLVQIDCWDL